jgi:hypothetical protein
MTPEQIAALRECNIIRDCILQADGDVEAALDAAALILGGGGPQPQRPWINEFGIAVDAQGVPLSLDSGKHQMTTRVWVDGFGVEHVVTVPMTDRDRQRNREQQTTLLMSLNAELERMSGATDVALSLLDRAEEEATAMLLYGAGGIMPPDVATTNVGPEVGAIASATLDTAKEKARGKARGHKGKARGKARGHKVKHKSRWKRAMESWIQIPGRRHYG